ncbi:hypothetical protein D3C78_915670 [compost metagenome]
MIGRHRQGTDQRMAPLLAQHQPGQGGAAAGGDPQLLVIVPAQPGQPALDHRHQAGALLRRGQTQSAFGDRHEIGIEGQPGRPEAGLVARAVTGVAKPVQLHAEGAQIANGGGVLLVTAQQADAGETETGTGGGQGMQVIGMGSAQADQAGRSQPAGLGQMGGELVPLVAADQRVDLVQTQQRQLHAGAAQPIARHRLQARRRWPVEPRHQLAGLRWRALARCRAQQSDSSPTKRLGESTRSIGMLQRLPLGSRATQLACW